MTLILETSQDKVLLDALRESCEKDPNSKLFMPLAEQLRRRGCYGEAIEICMRAKTAHPRYVSCRVLLGKCLIELGMKEEARRELEEVLELDRENVFSLRVMAEMLRAQGNLMDAVNYYRALLRISPTDMDAQQRLIEIAQLVENDQDRESVTPLSSSHPPRDDFSPGLSGQRVSGRNSPPAASLTDAPERAKKPRRGSAAFFEREIKRSDFSRFVEWVSNSREHGGLQQSKTRTD